MATHLSGPLFVNGSPVLPGSGLMGVAPENVYYVRRQGANEAYPDAFGSLQTAVTYASSRAAKRPVFVVLDDIREHVVIPNTLADGTVIGSATRPRHGDASPNAFGRDTSSWRSTSNSTALCEVRAQGWRFINLLLVGPTSEACFKLVRNADDGLATEQDGSHASFIGCRFASGYNGISDTGGCVNVLVQECIFQALTNFAILGVGNIGVGQSNWVIRDNQFADFTNGVKIAGFACRIEGNTFEDGGTPNTTVVLNTSNGGGGRNFVVRNYFQTATANFNTPDVVGNATDVWAVNASIDSTGAGVGGSFEWGQPA
jgi:hypothetical protein